MKSGFRRKHFSRAWVLDLLYEPLKFQSKIRISSFVPPSKIFVGDHNFMLPKRRFWKIEQKIGRAFSMQFSLPRSPNRVLTPLKSTSKMHARTLFCLPKSSFGEHKLPKKKSSACYHQWFIILWLVWVLQSRKTQRYVARLVRKPFNHCGDQKSRTFRPRSKVEWKS